MSITSINGFPSIREPVLKEADTTQPKTQVPESPTPTGKSVTATASDAKESQNEQAVQNAVDEMNKAMVASSQNVQFSMDKDLGQIIVKVVDTQTKEVLKQMPSPEALAMSKSISTRLRGLMIHDKA
jgi:flagellar protein FlaG